MENAFEKTLDPRAGSPATGKSVARIIHLFVDALFGTRGNEMEQRVLTKLKLVQRIGTMLQDKEFAGVRAIDELEEIPVERKHEGRPPLHSFSQRGMTVFLAESRERSSKDGMT